MPKSLKRFLPWLLWHFFLSPASVHPVKTIIVCLCSVKFSESVFQDSTPLFGEWTGISEKGKEQLRGKKCWVLKDTSDHNRKLEKMPF